ncbi:hypothetical protein ANTQUA_LOCUS9886 [Anthophora quadrimaculata]
MVSGKPGRTDDTAVHLLLARNWFGLFIDDCSTLLGVCGTTDGHLPRVQTVSEYSRSKDVPCQGSRDLLTDRGGRQRAKRGTFLSRVTTTWPGRVFLFNGCGQCLSNVGKR